MYGLRAAIILVFYPEIYVPGVQNLWYGSLGHARGLIKLKSQHKNCRGYSADA